MADTRHEPFGIVPPAYRLPAAMRLGPVTLQVADLSRSIEYYGAVIGLRILARNASTAALAPHGDDSPLVHLESRAGIRPAPPHGVLGLYHFAILLPDRGALGSFLDHLGRMGGRVGMADHAVSESVYLTDPDGLGIEVYADRPRSMWRIGPHRELYMTTARLDVPAVVAAAGGRPWVGMPAGTTMGHLHLHVGDLEQAAAFYHRALGFDKIVWSYPGALFLAAPGYHHHLGTNTWASGPPAGADQARLLSWDIVLPDEEQVERAAASLAAVTGVAMQDRARIAADPWGTLLRLVPAC